MTLPNPQRHVVPTEVITKSKLVPLTAVRPVTTAVPQPHVTRPRSAKTIVTKSYSPPRRNINRIPSPKPSNFLPKVTTVKAPKGKPQHALKDKGVIDSRCTMHMTWNMSYLSNFEEINGGYVTFGGNPKGGKINGKGKIRIGKLDFDDPYFVKELKFNLFSVSHMCDKKNNVLFTETECIVWSPEFKPPDENQVLLRVPRENNMYNVDLKNIVPSGDLTCLVANETVDESNLWHRRLRHINFKTMNKLVTGYMTPFGCPVPINTLDPLGKFDRKADEGFLVRYSVSSKAFRVFNSRTRIIQETLHINFLENQPNVTSSGPIWLFDIDTLTKSINYQPITTGNQSNPSASVQEQFDAEKAGEENVQQYVLFPLWSSGSKDPQNTDGDATFDVKELEFEGRKPESKVYVSPSSSAKTKKHADKTKREAKGKSPVKLSTRYRNLSVEFEDFSNNSINEVNDAALEDITYSDDEEDVGVEADFSNLETTITEDLLQFKMQKVWVLVDLPNGKRAIGTKWVFRNKKDERGIVVRNKARPVAQGHTQEKGNDYENFFAPVARIEAIRLFLAYASFMGFMVYQMDVKSAFLYGIIEEEVYVCQPLGFEDLNYLDKVYKVVKALYGSHQAPRAWRFGLTDGKSASTPIDTKKPLLKDPDGEDVEVHTYRSMIG
nr:copia protein [Tanacetum cinerariifolium]